MVQRRWLIALGSMLLTISSLGGSAQAVDAGVSCYFYGLNEQPQSWTCSAGSASVTQDCATTPQGVCRQVVAQGHEAIRTVNGVLEDLGYCGEDGMCGTTHAESIALPTGDTLAVGFDLIVCDDVKHQNSASTYSDVNLHLSAELE